MREEEKEREKPREPHLRGFDRQLQGAVFTHAKVRKLCVGRVHAELHPFPGDDLAVRRQTTARFLGDDLLEARRGTIHLLLRERVRGGEQESSCIFLFFVEL